MSKLNENLRNIRIDRRYMLRDIAEITGVSVQAVHQWETGETNTPIDKIVKIAKFYGITVDELISEGPHDEGRA